AVCPRVGQSPDSVVRQGLLRKSRPRFESFVFSLEPGSKPTSSIEHAHSRERSVGRREESKTREGPGDVRRYVEETRPTDSTPQQAHRVPVFTGCNTRRRTAL